MPPQSPLALAAAAAAGYLAATLLARRRRTPAPSRVRHMVLVQLKPGTPSDAVDAMLAALRRLPARIPTILRIEVGRQVASLDDGRNASIGGLVEFASEDDYRAYAKDPAHIAVIKDYILPHMAEGGRAAGGPRRAAHFTCGVAVTGTLSDLRHVRAGLGRFGPGSETEPPKAAGRLGSHREARVLRRRRRRRAAVTCVRPLVTYRYV